MNRLTHRVLCVSWCLLAVGCVASTPLPAIGAPMREPSAKSCGRDALDCCPKLADARHVSQCRLFAELVDLRHLMQLPVPDYTTHMVSSFDRTSEHARPNDPAWFANRDFALLKPGETRVLLDTDGPGVVTRIWSANPSGTLRVYLDGADQPVIEAPMAELLRGEVRGLGAPFAFEAASGENFYLPVAYQTHCTITVTSNARKLYYQVSYRRYPDDVQVEPFQLTLLREPDAAAVSGELQAMNAPRPGQSTPLSLSTQQPAGVSLDAAPTGSVLRELRIRPARIDAPALRQTLLRIWVDDEEVVRAPLGDFFGTGPGLQAVHALPVSVDAVRGELVSRWPMPYRRQLRIALETAGAPLTAAGEVTHEASALDADSLIFHAHALPARWQPNEPTHEYTLTRVQGAGFYVGTLLNVTNTEAAWWGEGDEKLWLDDEAFPSFFGTGTEDYFGYAWCSNERFSRPYIGQTLAGTRKNFGRVSLYRFHVPDPIRFRTSLRFDLEVNHWGASGNPVSHDSVVFFYAKPGAVVLPAPADARAFSVPELTVPEPEDVQPGPYRCR